jgi:predicted nucleotidyltransferase
MPTPRIDLPMEEIAAFCRKWRITEFALFGSVLRDDFRPDSDVDVLVTFAADARWGWEIVDMHDELADILGRKVDILTKRSVERSENYIFRNSVLKEAQVVLSAA